MSYYHNASPKAFRRYLMNNMSFSIERPENEKVLSYAPGSIEREELQKELAVQANTVIDIPTVIGGREIRTGDLVDVVMPHDHGHCLAKCHRAGVDEIRAACEAAVAAQHEWMRVPWIERASVLLKAAQLISGKYRFKLNAATMLGQSKNVYQAEIDAAAETADYLRMNVSFASRIYTDQPVSDHEQMNRIQYRPLEGFVFAVTPFNFTAIGANLPTAPALMGNTAVWKPATTSLLSNWYLMQIFREAGMPDGVINFIPSNGRVCGKTVLEHKYMAGIHFTGSTETFNWLWRETGNNLGRYVSYPRLVGETGGKNFVFAYPSADAVEVSVALARGAFEYQGQKCSAASRAYIPKSLWPTVRKSLSEMVESMKVGDVRDFGNFINAVIDENSFDTIVPFIARVASSPDAEIVCGGKYDKSQGYFIDPTVILVDQPKHELMETELFGPVLAVWVYDDNSLDEALSLCDGTSPYALTGAVFARDRVEITQAMDRLCNAAGNFYINDKPTGAVVGRQAFGGGRGSGTNDKAGSHLNLIRWVSPMTVKETFSPPHDYRYPFLQ
jgi:1-pyrroline-5-carboxylate dehydrogenase